MAAKGLQVLYNLILKDVVKGSGQASGILSIGKDVRKLADKKLQRYITAAKKQGVDLNNLSEQEAKYMLELNKPKAPTVLSNEEAYEFLNQFLNQGKKGEVIKGKFGKSFSQEVDDIADKKVIEQMYRTASPRSLDEDALYLAEFIAEDAGKVLDNLSTAEQNKFIKRAENALKRNIEQYRDKKAGGGRTGLSYLLAEDTNERVPFSKGKIVKKGLEGLAQLLKKEKGILSHTFDVDESKLDTMIKGTVVEKYTKVDQDKIKEEMDKLEPISNDDSTEMVIDHCFDVKGVGTVILGKVTGGKIKQYDNLIR